MNIMSMKKRSRLGFTLVELIVVIAILAILAGVAIPVYSGYIKKAQKAADLMLLDAVNTAFAAACTEYGFHPKDVSAAVLKGDKTITGVEIVGLKSSAHPLSVKATAVPASLSAGARPAQLSYSAENFAKSFETYFKGNDTVELKYYKTVADIAFENDSFVGKEDITAAGLAAIEHHDNGTTTYTFALSSGESVDYTVNDDAIEAVNNSTFGENMTMNDLLGEVTGMVDAVNVAITGGGLLKGMLIGPKDPDDPESEWYTLADWGVTAEEGTAEYLSQLSNAAVLFVATKTTPETALNLVGALQSGEVESLMGGDDMLSNMAGVYGIATAFANSDQAESWSITVGSDTLNATQYYDLVNSQIVAAAQAKDLTQIMNAIGMLGAYVYVLDENGQPVDDEEGKPILNSQFTAYITPPSAGGTSQMEYDVNGYVSGLQEIANNMDSIISTGAISSGFGNGEIGAILNLLFGN